MNKEYQGDQIKTSLFVIQNSLFDINLPIAFPLPQASPLVVRILGSRYARRRLRRLPVTRNNGINAGMAAHCVYSACGPQAGTLAVAVEFFGQKCRKFREKHDIPETLKLYAVKHTSAYFAIEGGEFISQLSTRLRHTNEKSHT